MGEDRSVIRCVCERETLEKFRNGKHTFFSFQFRLKTGFMFLYNGECVCACLRARVFVLTVYLCICAPVHSEHTLSRSLGVCVRYQQRGRFVLQEETGGGELCARVCVCVFKQEVSVRSGGGCLTFDL